jgi:hypothetical protein
MAPGVRKKSIEPNRFIPSSICIHYIEPVRHRDRMKMSERERKRDIWVYFSFEFLIKSCHASGKSVVVYQTWWLLVEYRECRTVLYIRVRRD